MQPTAYLFFNGQASDAVEAYKAVLGAEIVALMRMSDGPPGMDIPPERQDWIMHCELKIEGGRLLLSDDFMANSPAMEGCSVMLEYETAQQARSVFDQLAEGGEVRMAWEPTFWSAGFGTLTDRFGIRWMIGTTEAPA
jgi:PhnB protein